jgi:hypothetical protein
MSIDFVVGFTAGVLLTYNYANRFTSSQAGREILSFDFSVNSSVRKILVNVHVCS